MNGNANCIFEVCCPPGEDGTASNSSVVALAEEMKKSTGCSAEESVKFAEFTYKHFDLAPRGSLRVFKKQIVEAYKQQV